MDKLEIHTGQRESFSGSVITTVDLTNCDREPIHIPGRIQSHGYLVGFHASDRIICYLSDNIESLAGMDADELIGKSINTFFEATGFRDENINYLGVIEYAVKKGVESINPISLKHNNSVYNLIVHSTDQIIVLEFEPTDSEIDRELQKLMGNE